jgi:glutathione synthase/RimK-type ligase-like ATP-grasp enzyme
VEQSGARAAAPVVGIATCAAAPDLDEDRDLLRGALDAAGVAHEVRVWDDPDVDWPAYDRVLVRSCWDYPAKHAAFLAWVRSCRRTANPAEVLAWNTDKTYLRDLDAQGVPVIPTEYVAPGSRPQAGWSDVVVKPTVSGSAADTGRFASATDPDAVALVAGLHEQGRTAMVQPYLDGIDELGETSLVHLGGRFSHAVRREPLLSGSGVRGPVVVADVLATVRRVEPTPEQLAVAAATLAAVPGGGDRLTYARVDLVPGPDGPVLLELEATDCYLFLPFAEPSALARMVASARS